MASVILAGCIVATIEQGRAAISARRAGERVWPYVLAAFLVSAFAALYLNQLPEACRG